MSCRKAGPDSSGILSLSNSCLRPPGQEERFRSELTYMAVFFPHLPECPHMDATLFLCWALQRQNLTGPPTTPCASTGVSHFTEEDTEAQVGEAPACGYLRPSEYTA